MKLTPAQQSFLADASANWLGVAKCNSPVGFARKAQRAKALRLCDAGLMRRYVHGTDEFEITDAGREALAALNK